MTQTAPSRHALRVAELAQNASTEFAVRPDAATLKTVAADLELSGLRKVSLVGRIEASGASDWRLAARLGATVVQPCVVTLDPVTTRIDAPVERLYLKDYEELDAPEVEMPEDDTTEELGAWIDLEALMMEALALHIPLYPRSAGAELGDVTVTEPGVAPMTDEDAKPFAGLAALKNKMTDDDEQD